MAPRANWKGFLRLSLVTPDGRYFVVRGRLWRNPGLDEAERHEIVGRPMATRRAVRDAKMEALQTEDARWHKEKERLETALRRARS